MESPNMDHSKLPCLYTPTMLKTSFVDLKNKVGALKLLHSHVHDIQRANGSSQRAEQIGLFFHKQISLYNCSIFGHRATCT
jgi:hypothetical protein